jgi:hypothetical protein
MDDDSEAEFGPRDVGSIPPRHDAWVVGDEPFISIDFGEAPIRQTAKLSRPSVDLDPPVTTPPLLRHLQIARWRIAAIRSIWPPLSREAVLRSGSTPLILCGRGSSWD